MDLTRFRNIHKGETGVIIGNGPSLRLNDLKRLSIYPTFGSNKIYRLPFTPDYYCIIDKEMAENSIPLPETFKPKEMFIRAEYGIGNPIYPIVIAGFSLDISNFLIMGGTVSFALLQIAFYMGFSTILLLGIDHYYPSASRFTGYKIKAGSTDPDHFKCEDGLPYFDEGATFNAPEDTTQAYKIVEELFRKDGRRIINLTPGTHLDVFEKDVLENWF